MVELCGDSTLVHTNGKCVMRISLLVQPILTSIPVPIISLCTSGISTAPVVGTPILSIAVMDICVVGPHMVGVGLIGGRHMHIMPVARPPAAGCGDGRSSRYFLFKSCHCTVGLIN